MDCRNNADCPVAKERTANAAWQRTIYNNDSGAHGYTTAHNRFKMLLGATLFSGSAAKNILARRVNKRYVDTGRAYTEIYRGV